MNLLPVSPAGAAEGGIQRLGPLGNRHQAGKSCRGYRFGASPGDAGNAQFAVIKAEGFILSEAEGFILSEAEGSGIGDVGYPQRLGNLRGHLGGITIYRLHTRDDNVVLITFEQLRLDFSDCLSQGVSGSRSIGAAKLPIGEQHTGISPDG